MIAVGASRVRMRKGHLQLVHRLQERAFALVLQILEGRLLCDEIGMTNYGPYEESIIRDFLSGTDLNKNANVFSMCSGKVLYLGPLCAQDNFIFF